MALRCHVSTAMDCDEPVTHAESYYGVDRGWCEKHTPWSGHYEEHYIHSGSSNCSRALERNRDVQMKSPFFAAQEKS